MGAVIGLITGSWRKSRYYSLALVTLLAVGILLIAGCQETSQIIEDITVQEAFDLIESEQGNPPFAIIDVRTPEEYAEGHLENAVNIDFNADDFEDRINELNRDNTYVVYCRSGVRSGSALDAMRQLGFSEVYNVLGGIIDWTDAGFPVVE